MTQTIAKDTIKDELTEVLNTLKTPPSHDAYHTALYAKVETIIEEYDAFRKVAEYMSGMVESLQKKLDGVSENAEG